MSVETFFITVDNELLIKSKKVIVGRILNTNKILGLFLLTLLVLSFGYSQVGSAAMRHDQYDIKAKPEETDNKDFDLSVSTVPLEKPINPDEYIVGPGDGFVINIISTENIVLNAVVGPTGGLLIPAVGVVSLIDQNLTSAIELIKQSVNHSYKNSIVNVALATMRIFKVQVTGAVNSPGFVQVSPVDRLTDVIYQSDGLHKYADENFIQIRKNSSGEEKTVSLREYYLDGSLSDNPMIATGEDIYIPFQVDFNAEMRDNITANTTAILVTGHVNFPGPYRFITGYAAEDYIGMAGGLLVSGTMKKLKIVRNGDTVNLAPTEYILPGDHIYISENLKHRFLGEQSILATIGSIATLYLTYIAATK